MPRAHGLTSAGKLVTDYGAAVTEQAPRRSFQGHDLNTWPSARPTAICSIPISCTTAPGVRADTDTGHFVRELWRIMNQGALGWAHLAQGGGVLLSFAADLDLYA